jgi:hypothetical protein
MTRLFAMIAVLVFAAGCTSTDYGRGQIQTTPSTSGCPAANSPCAPGGDGL